MKIKEIKEILENESSNSEKNLTDLEKITGIWKNLAETEKINIESREVKKKINDRTSLWLNLLAPILSTITLIFTIFQFNENSSLQRSANEETKWMSFINQIGDPRKLNDDLTIPITLVNYFHSEKYANQSRDISLFYLQSIVDPDIFSYIFDNIYSLTTWENFNDLPKLSKLILKDYSYAKDQLANTKTTLTDSTLKNKNYALQKFKTDSLLQDQRDKHLAKVSNAIIKFIKSKSPPKNYILKMNGASFYNNDLSNIDFFNSDFEDASIEYCKINDTTNFINVSSFANSYWEGTAWWRTTKINDSLAIYLIKNYPYDSGIDYYNKTPNDSITYINFTRKIKE